MEKIHFYKDELRAVVAGEKYLTVGGAVPYSVSLCKTVHAKFLTKNTFYRLTLNAS